MFHQLLKYSSLSIIIYSQNLFSSSENIDWNYTPGTNQLSVTIHSEVTIDRVLKTLADEMQFELVISATNFHKVSGKYKGAVLDVINKIVKPVSVVVIESNDAKNRIKRIELLPEGLEQGVLPTVKKWKDIKDVPPHNREKVKRRMQQ